MQKDKGPEETFQFANGVPICNDMGLVETQQNRQDSTFRSSQERSGECQSPGRSEVGGASATTPDYTRTRCRRKDSTTAAEYGNSKAISRQSSIHSFKEQKTGNPGCTALSLPRCKYTRDPESLNLLRVSIQQPPIRKDSLSELDLVSVQNNLNLRVDLNYDFDVFFQPISGAKGLRKQQEGQHYWDCVTIELEVYAHGPDDECHECMNSPDPLCDLSFQPRLESMFSELRSLLEVLVPETNRDEVGNHLDVRMLMDQFHVGALDIISLTSWLHGLLTMHCAPIRDEMADEMVTDIESGLEANDLSLLVEGLSKLFCLCEAMKLDVANHQVRTFRLPLVKDTVPFQIDCFTKLKESGQIELEPSKAWYDTECKKLTELRRDESKPTSFECFIYATSRLCGRADRSFPDTFHYDRQRFKRLQDDLLDVVHLRICMSIFDIILSQQNVSFDRSMCHYCLSVRIMQLTEDAGNESSAISDHLDEISYEIARAAFEIVRNANQNQFHLTVMPDSYIKQVFDSLQKAFDTENRGRRMMQRYIGALSDLSWKWAIQFSSMSTLEISNAQRKWMQDGSFNGQQPVLPSLEDMARRVAHMGVLNWWVWSELAYLTPVLQKDEAMTED